MNNVAKTRLAELPLLLFFSATSISTLLYKLFLIFNVTFSTGAILLTVVVALSACVIVYLSFRSVSFWKQEGGISITNAVSLIALAGLGAVLAASINRPDLDDSVYVPKLVYYLENPGASINNVINSIAFSKEKLRSPQSAMPYEFLQAAFSYGIGAQFLTFYHVVFPAAVGFLILFSVFLATRLFCLSTRSAIFGTLVFLVAAITLGETHRTYGNLSFARAFHGKMVFLTMGLLSWTYFSLQYFKNKSDFYLIWLGLIIIAMAGMTPTTFVMIPFLSLILVISYWVSLNKTQGQGVFSIIDIVKYFCVHLPIIFLGAEFYFFAKAHLASGAPINSGFSPDFWDQLGYITNVKLPLTGLFFLLGVLFTIYFSSHRMFFICWICVAVVLFLNPLVAPFLIKYVTTENIYWRLFYLLPFPLLVAVGAAAIADNCRNSRLVAAIFGIAILGVPAALYGPGSIIRKENHAAFDIAGYKVSPDLLLLARSISNLAPPGPMLAPIEIASTLVMITSKYPQLALRQDYLGLQLSIVGDHQESQFRIAAASYLGGSYETRNGIASFQRVLKSRDNPRTVVVSPRVNGKSLLVSTLKESGFYKLERLKDGWILAVRAETRD